jgi:uncharacterized damage-inducible protein DinB
MKAIFEALALYNGKTNEILLKLLEGLSKEQITRNMDTAFHSIHDTLTHPVFSDLVWISRLSAAYPESPSLKNSRLPAAGEDGIRKKIEADYKKAFDVRREADLLLAAFIGERSDADFESVLRYKNKKGVYVDKVLWQVLLQMFNHHTHHRGNISAMLDIQGVKNDYSTLLTKI